MTQELYMESPIRIRDPLTKQSRIRTCLKTELDAGTRVQTDAAAKPKRERRTSKVKRRDQTGERVQALEIGSNEGRRAPNERARRKIESAKRPLRKENQERLGAVLTARADSKRIEK
jgi:hypothetical protein